MLQASQLHGFNVGGEVLTTLTQVLSPTTDSSGAAFTLPVGIQAGDLIINFDFARDAGLPADATPSGFGVASSINDGAQTRAKLNYKIADGSESGASVNGLDGTAEAHLVYVFRGNVPITSAVPTDVETAGPTDSNPGALTVNASGANPPLIVIGCYGLGLGAIDPRTFSTTKDGEINGGVANTATAFLAYKIYNSSPANTSIDMDDEGSDNTLISCYFACS
jgi:hypothetical protein